MAEAQAGYVMEALQHMRRHGLGVGVVEARPDVQAEWNTGAGDVEAAA